MKGLINVYKNRCVTPYEMIKTVRNHFGIEDLIKIGYAGRLDPLASGVLLLMIGKECKNRDRHQNHNKTYTFDIILGVSTDSLDPLGIINEYKTESVNLNKNKVNTVLNDLIGTHNQKYPSFSSKTINGISMYRLAKNNELKDKEIPSKDITIFNISLNSIRTESIEKYIRNVIEDINNINGYFRQDEVISSWKNLKFNNNETFDIINITTEVSSGTYIRVLAQEIAKKLDTIGIADNIVRTRVVNYLISDSLKIND